VRPFEDHSTEGNLRYFCAGLRDEIINRLSALTNLRVLAAGGAGDAPHGAAAAGEAAVIVTGSVRSSGDTVRVTTQFLDGATGCYLWSAAIDGTTADVFGTQERVAAAVADKLGSQLVDLSPGTRGPGTVNLAAHNLYLQGRYHLSQRTEEGLRKAVEFFERSLAEDAEYGRAHAGLSDAYALLAHYGVLGPADVWTKVASTAATAVMLDPSSAEAHTSLAHAKATQDWDWQAAEQGFRRAMALDPRYATAPHWYSTTVLVPTGRLDDAVSHMLRAQSLDPVSAIIARDVAMMYYYKREYDLALEQCDNAIELNPHFPPAYLTLAWVQEQRNELDESEAALERAVRLAPQGPRMLAALGRLFAMTGRRRQATRILHDLEAIAKERYVAPFELALLHVALGHVEESCACLSKAIDDRNFELLAIKADPRCEALRSHPRLAPLVARVGVTAPAAEPLAG
jgi:serine/threonine-protein kinase